MLTGGHINAIVKLWPKDGGDKDAVLVRVMGPHFRIREDGSSMATVMRVAEAGGVGAPVLAEFTNGVVYGFTVGDMIVPDVIKHDDHILG